MTRFQQTAILVLISLAACLVSPAEDAKKSVALAEKELARLVKGLGSADAKTRRTTLAEANKLPMAAREQLVAKLQESKDPELRFAAKKIRLVMDVAGDWETSRGKLVLTQSGPKVTGMFNHKGFTGTLKGNALDFVYTRVVRIGNTVGHIRMAGGGRLIFKTDSFTGAKGAEDWTGKRAKKAK